MFGELGKKVAGWFGARDAEGSEVSHPKSCRPWEDRTLSATERYQSYYDVARAKCQAIRDAGNRPGITAAERYKISQDPEANYWVNEFRQLKGETAEKFCWRFDGGPLRELLGKNFLGVEEWRSQKIDVGAAPPIPAAVTEALLNSECPLHPGKKIKDTHLLVLVPKTVNGEPYSALKLAALCAKRKGSGKELMYYLQPQSRSWKTTPWAAEPQAESEWVLLPKIDPDPANVPKGKDHFRGKRVAEQQEVHERHYQEYGQARTVELMTAVLLNDLVNGEPRMLDGWTYLRCAEPNASGGSACIGNFNVDGLRVDDAFGDHDLINVGRALVRKLKT